MPLVLLTSGKEEDRGFHTGGPSILERLMDNFLIAPSLSKQAKIPPDLESCFPPIPPFLHDSEIFIVTMGHYILPLRLLKVGISLRSTLFSVPVMNRASEWLFQNLSIAPVSLTALFFPIQSIWLSTFQFTKNHESSGRQRNQNNFFLPFLTCLSRLL